jgi:hypothetical protein
MTLGRRGVGDRQDEPTLQIQGEALLNAVELDHAPVTPAGSTRPAAALKGAAGGRVSLGEADLDRAAVLHQHHAV